MTILLAGDIGGTKTILRLVEAESSGSLGTIPKLTSLYEETYSSQQYGDLVPIVLQFFSEA